MPKFPHKLPPGFSAYKRRGAGADAPWEVKRTPTGRRKRTNSTNDFEYLDTIAEFREWCERKGLPYRRCMVLAIRMYMDLGLKLGEVEK